MSWIRAAEALELLDVKPQTLYANVSRGRVRAKPDPKDTRRSMYLREDVLRLAGKQAGRQRSAAIAAGTIRWGDPVMPSAVCTIAGGRQWYRGVDAVALSQTATLEAVAGLLWEGDALPSHACVAAATAKRADDARLDPIAVALVALAGRAGSDLPTLGRSIAVLRADAASVFFTLLEALLPFSPSPQRRVPHSLGIHERIAAAWRRPRAQDVIRRALVLLADHELTASTFAARVVVSTGASLAAGVLAGLSALSGPLHGRAAASTQALLEAARRRSAAHAVHEQAAQGRPFAAFGHPLYPGGDVRAHALLEHIRVPALHADIAQAVEAVVGERPNIDFALSAMAAAHRLPAHAPLTLFAIARCVGWLAHELEQATLGQIIRPRAHYTGPAVPLAAGTADRTQVADERLNRGTS